MQNHEAIKLKFVEQNCCVIIPTYNNQKTIAEVVTETLKYTDRIIVVNDGATDDTPRILNKFEEKYLNQITLIHQSKNLGKGMALRTAFKKALELGYRYAITIDSDGQHLQQ